MSLPAQAKGWVSLRWKWRVSSAWKSTIRSTALTDKLSQQAQKKVESQAETIYELEFTVANIKGFLLGLMENLGEIYKVMICDMFDNICGLSNDNVMFYKSWKSNERHKSLGVRLKRSRFIIPRFRTFDIGERGVTSLSFLADLDKISAYLTNEPGPFNGLVHAFKTQKIEPGARYATKYFDFRLYKGGTIHFFPKNDDVIEKINLFVGKVRRWLPTDMEEANADFRTQYSQAETFKERYQTEFSKRSREGEHCLVYGLLQASEDRREEYEHAISALSDSVCKVQVDLGIHAGTALSYQSQEQLLLTAA
ncbi:DUF4942 domain-containing protein [Comamonas sp. w2-DMI]|uniref:DUF4942 domain-containing protein n=1 Tax=Comamonas sp. w2-DMI TaxID=3126391 RepID=UPI0032E3A11E